MGQKPLAHWQPWLLPSARSRTKSRESGGLPGEGLRSHLGQLDSWSSLESWEAPHEGLSFYKKTQGPQRRSFLCGPFQPLFCPGGLLGEPFPWTAGGALSINVTWFWFLVSGLRFFTSACSHTDKENLGPVETPGILEGSKYAEL